MRTFFRNALVLFVVLNLMIVQSAPVRAQESTPETPMDTPTGTQIPVTETATVPPEEMTEETPTPTETSTQTATPEEGSVTPFATVTATPEVESAPVPTQAPLYNLALSSNPGFLTRAGVVNLNWNIEGEVSADAPLTMEIHLPAGFNVVRQADRELLDPTTGTLTISITSAQGNLPLQADQISNNVAFFARLLRNEEVLAETTFILPLHERFEVGRGEGRVQAMDGRVKIIFPDGALDEDIVLNAGFPVADNLPKGGFSENVFELTAYVKGQDTVEISQFNAPLTIEVDYSELALTEIQEDELYLYWYNEKTGDWHALESYRDKETKTLRAYSDHFTVFDIGVNDWTATRLPTVDSFQVSEFTGAATYSLPIEVPSGPGGFQPDVALSYNSQVVDQATNKAQASWVGMGWSLDGGMITFNSTHYYHQMHVNGVSTAIISQGFPGDFHAEDENFWKIVYLDEDPTNTSWQVFDTQGTQYFFENIMTPGSNQPDTWHLTRIKNSLGQEIIYTYEKQTKNVSGVQKTTAAYLSTITYPNQRYRVRFAREARTDYTLAWDADAAFHLYEKTRLANIFVEQDADGNGEFETIIRSYAFTYYDDADPNIIWPGISYSAGGKTSTLYSIQEFSNGASLPAHTFTYDGLHLTEASNGYGGSVRFEYDNPTDTFTNNDPFFNTSTPDSYKIEVPACEGHGGVGWVVISGTPTSTCIQNGWRVVTNGEVRNGYFTNSPYYLSPNQIVRPGGYYKIEYFAQVDAGSSYEFGLYTNTGDSTNYQPVSSNGGIVVLPKNAKTAELYFKTTGTAQFANITISLMPSFYRVRKKIISDGNENSYNYLYGYSNPLATIVSGESLEFLGHQKVRVTNPDSTYTETEYLQDDLYKGKVDTSCTYASMEQKISCVDYQFAADDLPQVQSSTLLHHAWVYLEAQTNWIYNAQGVPVGGTRTEYTYESVYGNLVEKKEYDNPEGSGFPYRITTTSYNPQNTSTIYIVNAPKMKQVADGEGNVLTETLYYYNYSTCLACAPTANILTMLRTKMDGTKYAQTDYSYDEWGNQTSVTVYSQYGGTDSNPPSGAQPTVTSYDPIYHTYPLKVTNALLQETTFEYDYRLGVPTSMTDANNAETIAGYDSFGRIISLIRPGVTSASLTMSYSNSYPFTTTITLPGMNYSITRQYDGMGRVTQSNANGILTDTIYVSPTETWHSIPYTSAESVYYTKTITNPATRTTTSIAPDGTSTISTTNGLTSTITDAKGNTTTSISDIWGRVTGVIPPTGPSVVYTYDVLGHLLTSSRGGEINITTGGEINITTGGEITIFTYDNAGRKLTMNDPDMGIWKYTYDALGNLKTQADARVDFQTASHGCMLFMTYDALNRLISKVSSTSTCGTNVNTTYGYDAGANGIGHRTSMNDTSGSTAWSYDARGRMTQETKTINGHAPFTTSWSYNNADLPVRTTYPDGEVVTQTYNEQMLVDTLWGGSGHPSPQGAGSVYTTYVASTTYDAAGRVTERTLGDNILNNIFFYSDWDAASGGKLQSILTSHNTNGFIIQHLNYNYDPAGNITSIVNVRANETQSYQYDAINRLTSWTLGNVTEEYGYDDLSGNLESKADNSYVYDLEHPHAVASVNENGVPAASFEYDANGNMVERTINGEMNASFGYDAEGRLVSVSGVVSQTPPPPLASPTPVSASPTPTIPPTATFTPAPTYTPTVTPAPIFQDVPYGHPYKPYIEKFYTAGITAGCATNPLRFCPSNTVSRAEVAVFLLRAKYGATYTPPAVGSSTGFTDVPTNHWAAAWIKQFAAEGITSGCGGGLYCPETPVTREQFAVFALRANGVWSVPSYSSYSYSDIGSSAFKNWIQYLFSVRGIADYCSGGAFCPGSTLTRERAAFLILKIFEIPIANAPSSNASISTNSPTGAQVSGPKFLAMPLLDTITASFIYDGDGRRVAQTINGVTTYFVGAYYEETNGVVTKYYYAGSQRVAVRTNGALNYLLGDHLGSTSLTTDENGVVISEMRYTAWGEVRYNAGVTPTDYTYTGQYSHTADFGLMFYNARWYDPTLGRFAQADTIIPSTQGVQGWDRYAYVNNNPLRYTDPTGHMCSDPEDPTPSCENGRTPPPNNGGGSGGSGGSGGGGGGGDDDEEENSGGSDPDLCAMYGEGCGGGGKPLYSPTQASQCEYFEGDAFHCKIPISEELNVLLSNWSTAWIVGAAIGDFILFEAIGLAAGYAIGGVPGEIVGGIIGGIGSAALAAYDGLTIDAVQGEFDTATNQGYVEISRSSSNNNFTTYGGNGYSETVVNSPMSKIYVSSTIYILTGEKILPKFP